MSAVAITMMVLICGVVWGGFVTLLIRAAKQEKRKGEQRVSDSVR